MTKTGALKQAVYDYFFVKIKLNNQKLVVNM